MLLQRCVLKSDKELVTLSEHFGGLTSELALDVLAEGHFEALAPAGASGDTALLGHGLVGQDEEK